MLSICTLNKRVGTREILSHVSLTVKRGEVAVLLGPSGVGKSTLLRILNNLDAMDSGSITLDNKSFDLEQAHKKHLIGMVSQHFDLFGHLTVEENVTLALKKLLNKSQEESRAIAYELLSHYGLASLTKRYPEELSGGQKQRLAIVRALALKPTTLCFDEPTSALDPLLTSSVANNIQELAKEGYIILVASHDTLLIEKLQCTIHLMESGSIVQSALSNLFWQKPTDFLKIKAFISGSSEN